MKIDFKNSEAMSLAVGLGAQAANLQADWMKLLTGHFSSPWAMQKGEPFSLSMLPRQLQTKLPIAMLPVRGSSDDVFAALNPA